MKGELYFGLRLGYIRTEYVPLTNLAIGKPMYDGEYTWIFRYSEIKEVEAITGPIEIPEIMEKKEKEELVIPKWKGKDMVEIIPHTDVFVVVEHRKIEVIGGIDYKEIRHNVDRTLVDTITNEVINHMTMNKHMKTKYFAEKICKALGITRFNRISGSFDWPKLQGNRGSLVKFIYFPTKVLVWLGKIKHHRYGAVERIK